jgi:hypothetical protein
VAARGAISFTPQPPRLALLEWNPIGTEISLIKEAGSTGLGANNLGESRGLSHYRLMMSMEQDPRRRQIQRGRKHRLFASLLARLFMFLQIVDFVFIHNWRGVKGTLLRISISLCLVLAFTVICAKTAMFCKNIHGQLKLL